jgi:hypothetical protein
MDEVTPGIYHHYKGGTYTVIGIATHVDTKEVVVVYQGIQTGHIWYREYSDFTAKVGDVPRFKREA